MKPKAIDNHSREGRTPVQWEYHMKRCQPCQNDQMQAAKAHAIENDLPPFLRTPYAAQLVYGMINRYQAILQYGDEIAEQVAEQNDCTWWINNYAPYSSRKH